MKELLSLLQPPSVQVMPEGYTLKRFGVLNWGWVDATGYVSQFSKLSPASARHYAERHAEMMKIS